MSLRKYHKKIQHVSLNKSSQTKPPIPPPKLFTYDHRIQYKEFNNQYKSIPCKNYRPSLITFEKCINMNEKNIKQIVTKWVYSFKVLLFLYYSLKYIVPNTNEKLCREYFAEYYPQFWGQKSNGKPLPLNEKICLLLVQFPNTKLNNTDQITMFNPLMKLFDSWCEWPPNCIHPLLMNKVQQINDMIAQPEGQ
eukprot:498961_1